jgi:hypothetical protein
MKTQSKPVMMKPIEQVTLANLKIKAVKVPIVGTSPLIMHAFSQKIIGEMEAKQQGKAKSAKHAIRNPEEEYEASKHISEDGKIGFPAGGIKKCIVRGAKAVGLTMTDVRAGLFVEPDCVRKNLVLINGEPEMVKDPVRVGNGSADIRYRPYFYEWSAVLTITYNEGLISLDQVFQAIYAGGFGTGLGDWRPEKDGNNGRFTLQDMKPLSN